MLPAYIASQWSTGGSKSQREEVEDQKQPQKVLVIARDRASEVELEPTACSSDGKKIAYKDIGDISWDGALENAHKP